MQFAHQRLVVHRDLKSDNILVTEDGSPRLLDFGIAKLLAPRGRPVGRHRDRADEPHADAGLREPGADPRRAGARSSSDVYSLGVILYELLSGSRPLRFTTRTPEEILRVITQEDPLPPSTAVARAPAGEAALRRGETTHAAAAPARRRPRLRRAQGAREGSGAPLRLGGPARPGHPPPPRRAARCWPAASRPTYLLSRFVRRHRAAVITTAVVIAGSLIAGLAGTTWQASVARRERDRANRRFNDVRALAHAVVFDIHDAIANLPGSTKARETLVRHALRYLDDLSREAKGDVGAAARDGQWPTPRSATCRGVRCSRTSGSRRRRSRATRSRWGCSGACPGPGPTPRGRRATTWSTTQRMADLLRMMGRSEEAMALAVEAKRRIVEAAARHPHDTLLTRDLGVACDRLIDMKLAAGDTAGALAEYREGLDVIEPLFRRDPRDPLSRRAILISTTKMAVILAARGERGLGARLLPAGRAARARRRCARCPTTPTRAATSRSSTASTGCSSPTSAELDSAVVVYGRGMRISEELAAKDPDNTLQQADVATGHYEHRHDAEEAWQASRGGAGVHRRLSALRPARGGRHRERRDADQRGPQLPWRGGGLPRPGDAGGRRPSARGGGRKPPCGSSGVSIATGLWPARAVWTKRTSRRRRRSPRCWTPCASLEPPAQAPPGSEPLSSRYSQARAVAQSRFTVIGETPSTSPVSSMLSPPK